MIRNLTTAELFTTSLHGGPHPWPVRLLDVTPWAIRTVLTAPGQLPQARFERAGVHAPEYGYPAVTVDRSAAVVAGQLHELAEQMKTLRIPANPTSKDVDELAANLPADLVVTLVPAGDLTGTYDDARLKWQIEQTAYGSPRPRSAVRGRGDGLGYVRDRLASHGLHHQVKADPEDPERVVVPKALLDVLLMRLEKPAS